MMPLEPTIEKQSREPEVDRNNFKLAIIGAFGIASSLAAVYFLLKFLPSLTVVNFLLWIGFTSLFFIFVILQTLFIKSFPKLLLICILEALLPIVFFVSEVFSNPSIIILCGFALFVLFLIAGVYDGWRFLSKSLSIRFSLVSKNVLGKTVTGFLIFASCVTYVWYFELGKFNPEDGQKLISNSMFSIEPALKVFFPGTSMYQTNENFFRKVAESEFRKLSAIPTSESGNTIDFNILTKQQQEKAISVASDDLRMSFEKMAKIEIPKDSLVKDTLFSFLRDKIENFSDSTKNYFGIIVAFTVFSLFKSLFWTFGWVVRFFAFLFYKLLIILGFAYVSIETRNREFLLLS